MNAEVALDPASQPQDNERRDFIYIATGAFAAAGTGALGYLFLNQMSPSDQARAFTSTEYDLSNMEPGSEVKIIWRKQVVFIRYRTPDQVEAAKLVNVSDLRDRTARNANLPGDAPASDDNRAAPDKPQYLVMLAACTHFGCIPVKERGDYGGWFCPCHGSHYDTAGRIRKGPAPENLAIPPYEFISDTVIKIG